MIDEGYLLKKITELEEEIKHLKEKLASFEISQISGNLSVSLVNTKDSLSLNISEVGHDLNVSVNNGDLNIEAGDVGYNVSASAKDGDVFLNLEKVHGSLEKI